MKSTKERMGKIKIAWEDHSEGKIKVKGELERGDKLNLLFRG